MLWTRLYGPVIPTNIVEHEWTVYELKEKVVENQNDYLETRVVCQADIVNNTQKDAH